MFHGLVRDFEGRADDDAELAQARSGLEPAETRKLSKFMQRRQLAWQPTLSLQGGVTLYFALGVLFIAIGEAVRYASRLVVEHVVDYTDLVVDNRTNVGSARMLIDKSMKPPIYVQYELDGFFQNHGLYMKSRSDNQLLAPHGFDVSNAVNLADCLPWITEGAMSSSTWITQIASFSDERVNYPCGLVAKTVFNDKFVLSVQKPGNQEWTRLEVDSSPQAIAWPADVEYFNNVDPEASASHDEENQAAMNMWALQEFPPVTCEQQLVDPDHPLIPVTVKMKNITRKQSSKTVQVPDCTGYMTSSPHCNFQRGGLDFPCTGNYTPVVAPGWGVQSGHLMAWMRIAALPTFRKLWGRIDSPIEAGTELVLHFVSNFEVKEYFGRKAFVLTTGSSLGTGNSQLGLCFDGLGAAFIFFALAFAMCLFMPKLYGSNAT